MPTPTTKRHVKWAECGKIAPNWFCVSLDCGGEPDKYITWVEDNLKAAWSFRTLSVAEIRAQFHAEPRGEFFLEFAFLDPADGHAFTAQFAKPAGRA